MVAFNFNLSRPQLVTSDSDAGTPLSYALKYAALGWFVLPVWNVDPNGNCRCGRRGHADGHRPGKHPHGVLAPQGLNNATNDPEVIREWFTRDPEAGIGIQMSRSGLVALDVDPRNGGDSTLEQLEAEHGVLYSDCQATTQGGGLHRLFRVAPGTSYSKTLGAGIDLIHSTYICVEPTRGESGVYRWVPGHNPLQGAEPSAPPALLQPDAASKYSLVERGGVPVATAQTFEDLRSALEYISADDYDTWVKVGLALKPYGESGYAVWVDWSATSKKFSAVDARKKWDRALNTPDTITYKTIFHMAMENKWPGNSNHPRVEPAAPELEEETPAQMPEVYSLADFDLENLPPIKFLIPDWLPAGKLTLFSGHGGSGKSSVMLQVGALLAAGGQQVLGHHMPEEPRRVLFVSGEDEPVVNMTRLRGILRLHPQIPREVLAENFKFMNVAGCRTTTLVDFDLRTGQHTYTLLFKHLKEQCAEFKPDLIITDNNSILFGGNEIDRNQIQTYIHCVQSIYPPAAVVALHHVDKASVHREDGDGWSGSTQWHNAARARWTLSPVNDQMTLYLRKSNYGHDGWRGTVEYDEHARAHRLGEFSRLTRDQEITLRNERKEQAKLSATTEREQSDRLTLLSAVHNTQDRYPSEYGLLTSLGSRYEAYKKVLRKMIDEGEVLEAALPPGVKGESNRQKTYICLRNHDYDERYKL